jgi:hypothetical protein
MQAVQLTLTNVCWLVHVQQQQWRMSDENCRMMTSAYPPTWTQAGVLSLTLRSCLKVMERTTALAGVSPVRQTE